MIGCLELEFPDKNHVFLSFAWQKNQNDILFLFLSFVF